MRKIKLPSYLLTTLKILVSLGALAFVFTKIDFSQMGEILRGSRLWLLILALGVFAASKLIAAFRLNLYFRSIGITLNQAQNIRLYLLGMYYNLFLPGGIGGDGYKIYLLHKRSSVKSGRIFWAVLLDRVNGVVALCCLVLVFLYVLDLEVLAFFRVAPLLALPLGLLVFYLLIRAFYAHFAPILATTTLLSLLVQGLQVLCAFLILRAIGVQGHEINYLSVFLVSSIVAMIPLSIGGVGLRELTFLYGSRLLELDVNMSVALSLLFYLITALVSLCGLYFGLRVDRVFPGESGTNN